MAEKWRDAQKPKKQKQKLLRLPIVDKVLETSSVYIGDYGYFTIIALDPSAGLKHRYSVIRVYNTGTAECIGRELDLKLARKVAKS